MMGDFSAKVGSDNRGYDELVEQHGLREMNDNGQRFAEQPGDWGECLPAQKDTQGNMGIT